MNSSITKVTAVSGLSFEASIMPTGRPAPQEANTADRVLADPRADWLAGIIFEVADDNPIREEIEKLIAKRHVENKQIDALISTMRAAAHSALIEKHEQQKELCRAQLQIIDTLRGELREADGELNRATDRVSKARLAVSDAVERRKKLSRFATKGAIEKADAAIVTAQRKVEQAQQPEFEWRNQHNDLALRQIPEAMKRLEQLAAEELRLGAAVTGQGYTDPELGLQMPPRI
jgi:hypothetical protein